MQLSLHCFFFRGFLGEDYGICMALALALALVYGRFFNLHRAGESLFFCFFFLFQKKRKAKQNNGDIVTYISAFELVICYM